MRLYRLTSLNAYLILSLYLAVHCVWADVSIAGLDSEAEKNVRLTLSLWRLKDQPSVRVAKKTAGFDITVSKDEVILGQEKTKESAAPSIDIDVEAIRVSNPNFEHLE